MQNRVQKEDRCPAAFGVLGPTGRQRHADAAERNAPRCRTAQVPSRPVGQAAKKSGGFCRGRGDRPFIFGRLSLSLKRV